MREIEVAFLLINLYYKCGDHGEARKVFDKMPVRNLYSWNNMVSGYAKSKLIKPARRLFDKMPDRKGLILYTRLVFRALLGASANLAALVLGKQVHCIVMALMNLGLNDELFNYLFKLLLT